MKFGVQEPHVPPLDLSFLMYTTGSEIPKVPLSSNNKGQVFSCHGEKKKTLVFSLKQGYSQTHPCFHVWKTKTESRKKASFKGAAKKGKSLKNQSLGVPVMVQRK